MKVDVFTPEDHVGDVIGDLNRRRGMIKAQEPGATGVRIKAECQLSEMFGYLGALRTLKSGRGQFIKFGFNPNFRSYWKGTQYWLINAVLQSQLIQNTNLSKEEAEDSHH